MVYIYVKPLCRKLFLRKKTLLGTIFKFLIEMKEIFFLLPATGKTSDDGYYKNFHTDNSNYGQKVSYLQAKLSNLRVTCVCTPAPALFSLSFPPCRRSQFSLRHLWHARNHRLAKIRRPTILRLYCTHLQNKNIRNELITFCRQILVLMWITSLRISHAFLATWRFLASVVLIKKALSCRLARIKKTNQTIIIVIVLL